MSYRSGRLEPSYAYLMGKLKRSKDAVHRALTALREHGFLDWLRRHEAVELVEGPGPRVRQVSNAYRLSLPARAARLPGAPAYRAAATRRRGAGARGPGRLLSQQKASLPLSELPFAEVEDDGLGQGAGRAGAHRRGAGAPRAGARVRQAGRNPNSELTKMQRGG